MKKVQLIGIIVSIAIVSCKETKKQTNATGEPQSNNIITEVNLFEGYDEVFVKKNLADIAKLTLYKKSIKDDFTKSYSHSFIFEINNDQNWDEFYDSKMVIQLIPVESEREQLNDISKKQQIKSEYFSYDILENFEKESDNMIIGPDGERYFRVNVNSKLNQLEALNVFLISKKSNKAFGRKIQVKNYTLINGRQNSVQ